MIERRFGWLPEIVDPLPEHAYAASASSTPPEVVSLIRDLDFTGGGILDQGNTASCVGNAIAGAVRVKLCHPATKVIDATLPARRWIYRLSRETHNRQSVDSGTYISAALRVIRMLGWPSEERVPWDEVRINDAMDADARHHAYDQRGVVQEYSITSWGDQRCVDVRKALADGHPVVFGTQVDQAFLDCDDWAVQQLTGKSLGGHAMTLVGYDRDGCHVLNSWGHKWAMGGIGLLSWPAVAKRIRDLRVVTLAKEPTS